MYVKAVRYWLHASIKQVNCFLAIEIIWLLKLVAYVLLILKKNVFINLIGCIIYYKQLDLQSTFANVYE